MSSTDFFGLWLHVLALVTYGGATLALVAIVVPAARGLPDAAAARLALARALRIYDPLAIAALGVLVMTGTYITFGLGHRIVRAEFGGDPVDATWLTSMTTRLIYACALALGLLAVTTWLGLELGHPH